MNYARIIEGVAVDVSAAPEESFHPSIAADFVQVPDEVRPQWRLADGVWQAPPEPESAASPAPAPKVSPVEFKLLWTSAERVALNRFRQGTEPEHADMRDAVNDFFGLLEDPRLTFVDLGLSSSRAGVESVLALLQTMGVVSDAEARKAEILSGSFQ